MFLLPIKLDRVSFETKGRQNLQKTADFLIESIVFCPLVPPSWISLVDPTSAMYASAIYVSYIYVLRDVGDDLDKSGAQKSRFAGTSGWNTSGPARGVQGYCNTNTHYFWHQIPIYPNLGEPIDTKYPKYRKDRDTKYQMYQIASVNIS